MGPDATPPQRVPPATDAPRAESTDFILGPSSPDNRPEGISATGEFRSPAPADLTRTADGGSHDGSKSDEFVRQSVPGYDILRELGRGGMGVVYLARQLDLNRPVALKMILSGEHAGIAERLRFRREAEAVAALQHPNIVQIFEVGESHGRPYLAFEFVDGGSLASYLDGQPWPAKPAADLVEALARAVHFAHTRGIVHRDLKPANVLLGNSEVGTRNADRKGKSEDPLFRVPASALRVPKITDFGLAKRVDPESSWSDDSERTAPAQQTRTGAVVGTPSYLAPEQAAGKNRQVGPHTDTYALGAILYELLTGRPPFRGETPLDTVLQVMADDPVPPSKLRAKLPRDLETICLKCLAKEPRKRYASSADLADDLHRYLHGEAIAARPVAPWERAIKWMNRHPAATVMGVTSGLAVATLLMVSLYFNVLLQEAADNLEKQRSDAREAQRVALTEKQKADDERIASDRQKTEAINARQEAEAKKSEAERGVFALQLFKAAALGERDPQRALRLLDDRDRCPERLKDFTWRYVRGQCLVSEQVIGVQQGANGVPPAARVDHSPDGKLVATASGVDPLVRIWDVANKRLVFVLTGHQLAAHAIAFAPDGRTLATAGGDNTVRIWELPSGPLPVRSVPLEPKFTLNGHTNTVNAVTFSIDGRRLASAGADGSIRLWDVPPIVEGKPRPQPTASGLLRGHNGPVTAVAWAAEGVFSAGSDGRVVEWRLTPGGGTPVDLFKLKKQALALAITPDGELLAAAGDAEPDEDEPVIQLFRPLINKSAGQLRGHTGLTIFDLSFSEDGKRLASAGRDGTVRVWDVAALQERAVFRPEKEPRPTTHDSSARAIRGVSFAPNGLSIVSGGQDGAVRMWNFSGQKEEVIELDARAPLGAAVLSMDGTTLAVAERIHKQLKVWRLGDPAAELNPAPSRVLRGLEYPVGAIAISLDGSMIAAATADGAYIWRANADDRPIQVHKGPVKTVALRQDEIVIGTDDGRIVWLDLKSGKTRHNLLQVSGRPTLAVFSPDGRKLITAGGSTLQVWDADTGELLFGQALAHFVRNITAVAVRPGDTRGPWEMASADDGGLVKVWEFKPKVMAEGDPPANGQKLDASERPAPPGLTDSVGALAFTADGRTLASGGVDRAVRLRDPETGQERAALAGHTDTVLLVAFRADRVLITVGREGFARVWRAAK
ncbi:MAG TPA: protein kinase [Gemmataceae bacterium]|jgi:WD40 repeat protein/serine/threonine protein kinase|nr:protein kinase [Gemmataceae bacterium]